MNLVENQLSAEQLQTDEEDPLAEHWLETIDEDDPFGEGIRCDIQLHIEKLIKSGRYYYFSNFPAQFFKIFLLSRPLGFENQLEWIQTSLLIACSARLGTYKGTPFDSRSIYCVTLRNKSACPIVALNAEEFSALRSELFRFVMAQLNLYPSVPHTLLYPRIPHHWSADTLYTVAQLLGPPVRQCRVDFNLSLVRRVSLPFIDWPF